jgi:hypothetical protein
MRRTLLAMTFLLCLAGCGDSEPERPRANSATPTPTAAATTAAVPASDPVAAAIERYAKAVRIGDVKTICSDLLSEAVLERVKSAGGNCERDLIADAIAAGGPGYKVVVESVLLDGSRATARTRVTNPKGTQMQTQPLVREGESWKLSLGG